MMEAQKGPSQEQLSAEAVLQASLQRARWLGAFCTILLLIHLTPVTQSVHRDHCSTGYSVTLRKILPLLSMTKVSDSDEF